MLWNLDFKLQKQPSPPICWATELPGLMKIDALVIPIGAYFENLLRLIMLLRAMLPASFLSSLVQLKKLKEPAHREAKSFSSPGVLAAYRSCSLRLSSWWSRCMSGQLSSSYATTLMIARRKGNRAYHVSTWVGTLYFSGRKAVAFKVRHPCRRYPETTKNDTEPSNLYETLGLGVGRRRALRSPILRCGWVSALCSVIDWFDNDLRRTNKFTNLC